MTRAECIRILGPQVADLVIAQVAPQDPPTAEQIKFLQQIFNSQDCLAPAPVERPAAA